MYDKNGLPQNFEFTKNGSSIVGTFYGKDQVTTGNYRLELVENEGKPNMVTLDYIDCFILSAKLKNTTASGNDSSYGIKTDVVNLASNINIGGSLTSAPADIDLSSYAKISYVDAKLALKANLSDIPRPVDTSNFALKSEIPNITEYAKKSEIPSLDNVATKDEIPNMDDYVKTEDLPEFEDFALIVDLPDMREYAKKSEIPSMENVATKDELFSGDYNDLVNKPTIPQMPNMSNYALKSELPDMENVATKDEIFSGNYNDLINKPTIPDTSKFALKTDIPDPIDTSDFATKDEIPVIPEFKTINGSSIIGSGNITIEGGGQAYDDTEVKNRLTALESKPDNDTIYDDSALIGIIEALEQKEDADTIYDDTEIRNLISGKQDAGDYALKSELPDMSNVATKDEIPVIPEFKTINGNSIIGTGNITIEGGGQAYDDTEIRNLIAGKQDAGDYALKSEIPTSTGLNEDEVNALIDAKIGEIETKLSEI